MTVRGHSENYRIEQERLNNTFGAWLKITSVGASKGPAIEFLENLSPGTGRPMPADTRANDLWHWQIRIRADSLDTLSKQITTQGGALVSPGVISMSEDAPFPNALHARGPTGHAVLIHDTAPSATEHRGNTHLYRTEYGRTSARSHRQFGQACAQAFRDLGARCVLADRSNDRLQERYPAWDSGRHMLVGGVDLPDESAATDLVARIIDRFGRVDVVVNTVGAFRGGQPVQSEERATWNFLMSVNLMAAVIIPRAVIPVMLRQGNGRIVHIASRNAFHGTANYAAYSAAKAALLRFSESLADEVKDHGITVNCLVPGTIDTPENRRAMPKADTSGWVSPAALADVTAFLASAESSAITGAAVPVFGRG